MITFSISEGQIRRLIGQVAEVERGLILEVGNAVQKALIDTDRNAKRTVPVDTGALRASINMASTPNRLGGMVWTEKPYGPFIEFGTGALVSVPSGREEFAGQFKGKGVRKVNRKPRPFLFPAFDKARVVLLNELHNIFRRAGK